MTSSRFTLHENPPALPGHCGICGSATKEQYLDLNLSFDYYGVLYFCNDCIADIARQLGYALPGEVVATNERLAEAVAENLTLKHRLRASEAYIRESFGVEPADIGPVMPVATEPASPDSDESDEVDEESDDDEGQSDSEAAELVAKPRSYDVRNPTSPSGTLSL